MKLSEAARVVRSKNAGPLSVTVDIMFETPAGWEMAAQSPALTPSAVARAYGVTAEEVMVMPVRNALAIKITLPRPCVAGSPGDRDVYGAQQHLPLLEIEL